MRTLPAGLAAHLASGATTLCRCWRLERKDGAVLGFTDHDADIAFESVTYRAATGLTASRAEAQLGLAVDELAVAGVLADESLLEADLAQGLYDEAAVTLFLVNWANISERTILRAAVIGEVTRGPAAFAAELRGLAHRLDQPFGRRYRFGCDADLGDARCGVDLEDPAFKGEGAVATLIEPARIFTASGLGAFANDHFTRGRVVFTSAANAGLIGEVKRHSVAGGTHALELWLPAPVDFAPGDEFTVTAGCDKQFATCRARFANEERFRGFPHMPGNDFVVSYPGAGEAMDGGSRYK